MRYDTVRTASLSARSGLSGYAGIADIAKWHDAMHLQGSKDAVLTQESFVTLRGIWAAKIWIVAPALISLPIMWLFGEGDYIVPIWAVLWTACFVVGLRIRARAEPGTWRRSQGFWVSFWSLWLALVMFVMTGVLATEGHWRWSPPAHSILGNVNGS